MFSRKNTAGASCARSISGLCTANTAIARCISRFRTADTCGLAQFRGSLLLCILRVIQVLRGSVLRNALTMPSMRNRSLKNCSTICAPCRNFTIILQKTFTDGPTSGRWSKLLSVGATRVLKSTGSISGLRTATTRSTSRFCTVDTGYTPKYFGVRYCGYCLYSGFCTAHLHSQCSMWSFTRSADAASTPILSVLGVRDVIDTPEYTREYEAHWEHLCCVPSRFPWPASRINQYGNPGSRIKRR